MSNFVGSASTGSQSTNSVPVPLPTGWKPGHLCIAQVNFNSDTHLVTPPAGWTLLVGSPFTAGSTENVLMAGRLKASYATSAPTVLIDGAAVKASATACILSAYDKTNPLIVGTLATRGASVTTCVASSINTTASNQRIVGFFGEKSSSSTTLSPDPTGMTRRQVVFTTGSGEISAALFDQVIAVAGATGTRTATYNVASGAGYALLVAVNDGTAGVGLAPDEIRPLTYNMNRLAGTTGLAAQGAANIWAGTSGLSLVGALNVTAGTTGVPLVGVLNLLAGTQGLGVNAASSRILA